MRPLSLYEAGRSSGEISIAALLDGHEQRAGQSSISISSLAELICAGGWPGNIGKSTQAAMRANRGYMDDICRVDISRVSEARRDPFKVERLVRSLVIRDLRTYTQATDARVFHYREKDGLEVDAIVEAADGRWAAFEIKLGESRVKQGAESLRKFADRMQGSDRGKPSALAVIVPSGYGYSGGEEVGTIPLGALGP